MKKHCQQQFEIHIQQSLSYPISFQEANTFFFFNKETNVNPEFHFRKLISTTLNPISVAVIQGEEA